jgi:glycine cleavage system H lipoate-binding protein
MAKKKLSLKPVAAALKEIVTELKAESTKASGKRKTTIDGEITKINALIAQVPPACKKYNVG